jgi:hypothetical protein
MLHKRFACVSLGLTPQSSCLNTSSFTIVFRKHGLKYSTEALKLTSHVCLCPQNRMLAFRYSFIQCLIFAFKSVAQERWLTQVSNLYSYVTNCCGFMFSSLIWVFQSTCFRDKGYWRSRRYCQSAQSTIKKKFKGILRNISASKFTIVYLLNSNKHCTHNYYMRNDFSGIHCLINDK